MPSFTPPPRSSLPPRGLCRHCSELHPPTFSHCPQTGRSLTAGRALVGRVIANRYRILALIGEGGMGAVYVAEHLLIGRKVAVKRLHPELAGDDKAIARFQREARAAGSTGHEHVVEVIDLGYSEDGAPFLVMEYVRGQSLGALLEREGTLDAARACRIIGQVLDALSAVHGCGVVHRDLKPDNILLTRRGADPEFVKVVDFGVSKITSEIDKPGEALTRTGVMLGTPYYMSPEQARGMKDLDFRVDLYSVGVMLYEALAGEFPFDGENYHQLLQRILSGNHKPIGSLRPDLDPKLVAVVERAIASTRERRFPDAVSFLQALLPFGAHAPGNRPVSEPPRAFSSSAANAFSATALSVPEPTQNPTPHVLAKPTVTYAARTGSPAERARRSTAAESTSRSPTRSAQARPSPGPSPRFATRRLASTPARGTAPAPTAFAAVPRRFVAQSSDWRASSPPSGVRDASRAYRHDALRGGLTAEVAAPRGMGSRREPARPGSVGARETPWRGSTEVKGSLLLAALDYFKRRGPETTAQVMQRLPEEARARIETITLPMTWLGLADYAAVLRAAERALGSGDGGVSLEIGVATAERELTTTHRLFMATATPTQAAERIPQLFRAYHSSGRAAVERASTGGLRVTVEGIDPDTLTHAMAWSGFIRHLVERAGGREVRASVVSCAERGDPQTATILRWR